MKLPLICATVLLLTAGPNAFGQTISDRVFAAGRDPGAPLIIGLIGEPRPLSIAELTKESDLIIEARVRALKTYVNDADTAVLTDFELLPVRELAGHAPAAGPFILRTYGGEVIRYGVTVRAENHDSEPLKENVVYLLFLKKFGADSGVYQIHNAGVFERTTGSPRPLARQGADLFRDFARGYRDVVARVQEAKTVR